MSDVDIDLLIRGRSSRRRWLLLGTAAVLVAAAAAGYVLLRSDESDVVVEPQRAEAVTGQLSSTVDLSGSAAAERSADLSFDSAGVVASVEVESGDAVRTGDALATLDDAEAQRRVETAEVQLRLAQLRLDALLADPGASAIASARQSIKSAESQVLSAEQALARLSEPPGASELASAEQAVANALGQLSSAEQALAQLSEPPGASDLASAEQAVANALGQLSSAEQALATLIAGPSKAEIASARSAVTQARAQLSSATSQEGASHDALTDAFDEFCERYDHLTDVREGPCAAELPLSDEQIAVLRDSFEDRSANYQRFASGLINANVAFIGAAAAGESATSALVSAEERLDNLLAPLSAEDRQQAELAVEAARANHAAAVARLQDLQAEPSDEDVRQAELAVEAARANHAAAAARLDDLQAEPSEEDVRQAELAVEAARANHAAAAARLEDLQAEPSEEDVRQAELAVEAARANHAAAAARLDDLQAEPSAEDVRQAELAVEAARANHAAAAARLDDLQAEPSAEDVRQAELAVEAAQANHAAAVARLEDLRAPADEGDVEQARSSLESARASLVSAQARYDELLAGATANTIAQQEQSVRLSEISLEEARAALTSLTVLAPFDGVAEAVNVQPGDRVTANFAAFSLGTSERMLIELTVTEADLLSLEVGQAGLASFDAIDDVEYPVRIASISRVPNAAQGVVTYDVEARILIGAEIAEVASEIAALVGQDGGVAALLDAAGGGAGAAGGFGGGAGAAGDGAGGRAGAGGAARGPLAGLELPEGVTIQQLLQALAVGEPLPEGVTLPEGFEIPPQLLQRLAAGARQGAGARHERQRHDPHGAARGGGAGPSLGRPPARRRMVRDRPGSGRRLRNHLRARHRRGRWVRRRERRDHERPRGRRGAADRRRQRGRRLQRHPAGTAAASGAWPAARRRLRRWRGWPMIRLRDLTRVYATGGTEVHALAGVSLEIGRGEFVAIMGQSGSGKTTMMNIIGLLDRPSGGEYAFGGRDVSQLSEDARARLRGSAFGFVFQSYNLLPRMTALEQVELPLIYQSVRDRRRRAAEALVRVGLRDRITHQPTELSGGEQQRVAIARSLVVDPLVLLADEPTGALDTATGHELMTLLAELVDQQGLTVVLVTHEPEVAAYARRTVRMRDGRIIEDSGAPETSGTSEGGDPQGAPVAADGLAQ